MTKKNTKVETPDMPELVIDALTVTGDVRDAILDRIRNLKKPYEQCSEEEQGDIIYGATAIATNLVREVVKIVAAAGRKCIVGDLEQVTIKDGYKAVITLSKSSEYRHELADSQGKAVLVVVADMEEFVGEKAPAKPTPDQRVLVDFNNDQDAA